MKTILKTISDFIPKSSPPCTEGKGCPDPVIIVEDNPFKPSPTDAPPAQVVGTGMDIIIPTKEWQAFLPGLALAFVLFAAGVLWMNRKG